MYTAHTCLICFLKYGYLLAEFMRCMIIFIVKHKAGNLTDTNSVRTIVLLNSVIKIFECILLDKLMIELTVDAY